MIAGRLSYKKNNEFQLQLYQNVLKYITSVSFVFSPDLHVQIGVIPSLRLFISERMKKKWKNSLVSYKIPFPFWWQSTF